MTEENGLKNRKRMAHKTRQKVSTQTKNDNSQHRNRTYVVLVYFGPSVGCIVGLGNHVASQVYSWRTTRIMT